MTIEFQTSAEREAYLRKLEGSIVLGTIRPILIKLATEGDETKLTIEIQMDKNKKGGDD